MVHNLNRLFPVRLHKPVWHFKINLLCLSEIEKLLEYYCFYLYKNSQIDFYTSYKVTLSAVL